MARPLFVKVLGEQKSAEQDYIKKDGSWRAARLRFAKDGGVWRHAHDFLDYELLNEGTCISVDEYRYNCPCGNCGNTIYGDYNPNNHVGAIYNNAVVKATCVSEGVGEGDCCNACRTVWLEAHKVPIDPDNHAGPLEAGDTEATCVIRGDFTCTACGKTVEGELDPNNHKALTCSYVDELRHQYYCSDCLKDFLTGHTYYIANEEAPTCISKGGTSEQCNACGAGRFTEGEALDPNNHAGTHSGYTYYDDDNEIVTYRCCGAEKFYGHSQQWYTWNVESVPTCSTYGIERRYCPDCDTEQTNDIPLDPDNHEGPIIEGFGGYSTCITHGWSENYCQACGELVSAPELPLDPNNHEDTVVSCDDVGDGAHSYSMYCNACHTWVYVNEGTEAHTPDSECRCTECGAVWHTHGYDSYEVCNGVSGNGHAIGFTKYCGVCGEYYDYYEVNVLENSEYQDIRSNGNVYCGMCGTFVSSSV